MAPSNDAIDPGLTEPEVDASSQVLQALGRAIAATFKRLVEARWVDDQRADIPPKRRIAAEEERFRLWARTLGLFQTGHASLDYRVRDATLIKASLVDLLTELQDHLQNLLDIALGTRLPLERDKEASQTARRDDDSSCSEDEPSLASSTSSMGSFQEADLRLSTIAIRLDSLYKLASRIRSPRNRQQRPTKDLYKHIPESQRTEYIQNQEKIQVSLVAYVQRQQLGEWVSDEMLQELGFDREELVLRYASANHWLITRTGIANARRKQQFLYWKKHAQLLGRNVTEEAPAITEMPANAAVLPQPTVDPSQASKPAPTKSMATSATKMNLDMMGPEDMKSTISYHSRVSTVANPQGGNLAWPPAPSFLVGHKYFPCPYCGILCPARYLKGDDWRIHQIHDLQPYHCTYEDCSDPGRLYGVKQEWIDHENQHRRVWHCYSHEAEFETQPEYIQHLKEHHPESGLEEYTPEIIATVVGASVKPHRDCPFCPTTFSNVTMMQKHIRYHLERLALYALPDTTEDKGDEFASGRSNDSHQVIENRGRQDSIGNDFDEERQTFLTSFAKDNSGRGEAIKGGALLSKVNMKLAQLSSPTTWLDACLASLHAAPLDSEVQDLGMNIETAKLLIDKGADINAQGDYDNALYTASASGHIEIVKLLLDKGADINAQGGGYGNALYAASTGGYLEIAKLLLDKGADINAQGGGYGNALSAASAKGHLKIAKLLLDKGADINAQGGEYSNALSAASDNGHIEIAKLLLDKGAIENAKS